MVVRADAAFAKPEVYEAPEKRGVNYAIRIPVNENLERDIAGLLPRPVEHHQVELFPRVGFDRYELEPAESSGGMVLQQAGGGGALDQRRQAGGEEDAAELPRFRPTKCACSWAYWPSGRSSDGAGVRIDSAEDLGAAPTDWIGRGGGERKPTDGRRLGRRGGRFSYREEADLPLSGP